MKPKKVGRRCFWLNRIVTGFADTDEAEAPNIPLSV
jgi:hypothetical protein